MAYYERDRSFGCLFYIIIFVIIVICSGIRSCTEHLVNGEIKLPKSGSKHVSGGSGGLGTSNGYNVSYTNTTPSNNNSSTTDFSYTNNSPTEYHGGNSFSNSNISGFGNNKINYSSSNSIPHNSGSTMSSGNSISFPSNIQSTTISHNTNPSTNGISSHAKEGMQISEEFSTTRSVSFSSFPTQNQNVTRQETCPMCHGTGKIEKTIWYHSGSWFNCGKCNRTDTHCHQETVTCERCLGTGKVTSYVFFDLPSLQ